MGELQSNKKDMSLRDKVNLMYACSVQRNELFSVCSARGQLSPRVTEVMRDTVGHLTDDLFKSGIAVLGNTCKHPQYTYS